MPIFTFLILIFSSCIGLSLPSPNAPFIGDYNLSLYERIEMANEYCLNYYGWANNDYRGFEPDPNGVITSDGMVHCVPSQRLRCDYIPVPDTKNGKIDWAERIRLERICKNPKETGKYNGRSVLYLGKKNE